MKITSSKMRSKRNREMLIAEGSVWSQGCTWPDRPAERRWHFSIEDNNKGRYFEIEVNDEEMMQIVLRSMSIPDFRAKIEAELIEIRRKEMLENRLLSNRHEDDG